MKRVLFTGASSFTGLNFVKALTERDSNLHVLAPLTRRRKDYEGIRESRINEVGQYAEMIDDAPIGSVKFTNLLKSTPEIDLVCLHHASVGDYKSAEFDVISAISSATANAKSTAKLLADKGASKVVLTRSVFESGLGTRSEFRPVSLYAIAKRACSEIWHEAFQSHNIETVDFVITNPFGPNEEKRLVSYLVSKWTVGETPHLSAPQYIRDNIPVPLLASAYANFLLNSTSADISLITPSCMVGTNKEFSEIVASRFGNFTGQEFRVSHEESPQSLEPMLLIGKNKVRWADDSAELSFWDQYAHFYFG